MGDQGDVVALMLECEGDGGVVWRFVDDPFEVETLAWSDVVVLFDGCEWRLCTLEEKEN